MNFKSLGVVLIAAAVLSTALPSTAQIVSTTMFRSNTYEQTGDATVTKSYSFLSLSLFSENAGDFGAVTATPGAGAPVVLTPGGARFDYQTPTLVDQATMDSAFPMGTYSFNATGGTQGPVSTSFDYLADVYPTGIPSLTGTSFSSLQGVDATSIVNLTFSPFPADAKPNNQFMFFLVYDYTAAAYAYTASFLPINTPGVSLAANTLIDGHNYVYEVIFSNRVLLDSPNARFPAEVGFDVRTRGLFTAGGPRPPSVPEPGKVVFALSIAASGLLLNRRRK